MTFGTAKPQGLVWAVIQDAAGGDVCFFLRTGGLFGWLVVDFVGCWLLVALDGA